MVKTRSAAQIRSHAQKYKLKLMYDDAQEKFKTMKEEERFFFKIVKAKKRKGKGEQDQASAMGGATGTQGLPNGGMVNLGQKSAGTAMPGRLFEVKKYTAPHGSSSNKNLPSSNSSSSEDAHSEEGGKCGKQSSNESMQSVGEQQER